MTEEKLRTLLDRFSSFVTSYRVPVLVLTLLVAIGFGDDDEDEARR